MISAAILFKRLTIRISPMATSADRTRGMTGSSRKTGTGRGMQPNAIRACCYGESCELLSRLEREPRRGKWEVQYSECEPNPCAATCCLGEACSVVREAPLSWREPNPRGTVDLHLHTTASDGSESPWRLFEMARDAGLGAIGLSCAISPIKAASTPLVARAISDCQMRPTVAVGRRPG